MIYLDHAATTPLDPKVFEVMEPWLKSKFGNASSVYKIGREARSAIEEARNKIASVVGCNSHELIFTSGGTESNNLALFGVCEGFSGGHIVCSAIEHPSVLYACRRLEDRGLELTIVPVNEEGLIDPDIFAAHVRDDTILVSMMKANNEIGTIQPVEELRSKIKREGLFVHSDCVQALPWLSVNVSEMGVDMASFCSHKLGGPQGIGVLYVKDGTPLVPQSLGGLQEFKMRAGTESVASIVGFAEAVVLREKEKNDLGDRLSVLRDDFIEIILESFSGAVLNGSSKLRLPNNVNISIPGVKSETLVIAMDLEGVAVASGSACHSGLQKASYVIEALGEAWTAESALRFSFGNDTSKEDLDTALTALKKSVALQS